MKKRSNKGKSRLERTRGEGYEPVLVADKPKRFKVGRPSEFDDEVVDEAAEMARSGATDGDISERLGVARSTIYAWKNKFPHFGEALDDGKRFFDDRIERTLAERAAGYTYMRKRVMSDGSVIEVAEHIPPDVGASKLWLQQRGRFKPDSVLGELGLNPGDLAGASQAEIGVRALAIGALALLGAAAHNTQQPATIDVTPNRQEEIDDDDQGTDFRGGDGLRARPDEGSRGAAEDAEAQPDDRDPDFDF